MTWKIHTFQALIEHIIQSQSLKVVGPRNLQGLVEIETQSQVSKAFWKVHIFQTLIETIAKGQCFQGWWKDDIIQSSIKGFTKSQGLQSTWQIHIVQTLVIAVTSSDSWLENRASQVQLKESCVLSSKFYLKWSRVDAQETCDTTLYKRMGKPNDPKCYLQTWLDFES